MSKRLDYEKHEKRFRHYLKGARQIAEIEELLKELKSLDISSERRRLVKLYSMLKTRKGVDVVNYIDKNLNLTDDEIIENVFKLMEGCAEYDGKQFTERTIKNMD